MAIKAPQSHALGLEVDKVLGWESPRGREQVTRTQGRNLLPLDITLSGEQARPVPLVLSLSAPPVLSSGWTFSPQLSHRVRKRRQLMSVHSSPPTTTQSTLPPPGKLLRIKGIVYRKDAGAAPTSPASNISNNNNAHGVFIPNHLAPHQLLACPLVTPSLNPPGGSVGTGGPGGNRR